jgi:hypothetical protein
LPYTASLSLASLSLSFSFKLFFQLKDFEGRQSVARFMTTFSCWTYQRAILNFTPGPQGCISPLGAPPGVNTIYCLKEWRGEQRISPPGDKFTPGWQIHPWGQSLPLGVKLRMGLRTVEILELECCYCYYYIAGWAWKESRRRKTLQRFHWRPTKAR